MILLSPAIPVEGWLDGGVARGHAGRIGALRTPLFSCFENSIAVHRGQTSLLGFALASIAASVPFCRARGLNALRGYNCFNLLVIMNLLEQRREEVLFMPVF